MPEPSAAAPWTLHGRGYIFVYRFPPDFVQQQSFLSAQQHEQLQARLGAVMLVDYADSPVGPYHELLFVPGRVAHAGQTHFTISKIYVSTQASVENGQRNWGIPKELARFDWARQTDGSEIVRLCLPESATPFASFRLSASQWRVPVRTLIPAGLRTLQQTWQGRDFWVAPRGRGSVGLARLTEVALDPAYFPDVSGLQPMLSLCAEGFQLTFPVARIKEAADAT